MAQLILQGPAAADCDVARSGILPLSDIVRSPESIQTGEAYCYPGKIQQSLLILWILLASNQIHCMAIHTLSGLARSFQGENHEQMRNI
jgi:hypothetical protein